MMLIMRLTIVTVFCHLKLFLIFFSLNVEVYVAVCVQTTFS